MAKKMNKYKNMYCPVCLHVVDPKNGSHWTMCEYEPREGFMPLSERQMIIQSMRLLSLAIKEKETELNAMKERLKKMEVTAR